MWEEDPKVQEAIYRFLVMLLGAVTVGMTVWAVLEGDWMILGYWMICLVGFFLALCIYAAVVWMIGHAVVWLGGLLKRVFQQNYDA